MSVARGWEFEFDDPIFQNSIHLDEFKRCRSSSLYVSAAPLTPFCGVASGPGIARTLVGTRFSRWKRDMDATERQSYFCLRRAWLA